MPEIKKPQFVIDKMKMIHNIEKMVLKGHQSDVYLRPHVKTHQSLSIAEYYNQYGITRIAVSSVDMARYFIQGGWQDVLICVPVNILQISEINSILHEYPGIKLQLLVDNYQTFQILKEEIEKKVHLWIEIDVGQARTGIPARDIVAISHLVKLSLQEEKVRFEGILTHAGQSYHATTNDAILSIYHAQMDKMKQIKSEIERDFGIHVKISVGDTPTCSLVPKFDPAISEIRPGNYIFYDVAQHFIGSCEIDEIAGAVACPIIGIYPDREELVVYGGSVHFSYYHCAHPKLSKLNESVFGLVCKLNTQKTWEFLGYDVYLKNLTQEHGQVHVPKEILKTLSIGDVLYILPYHSCTAANLFSTLHSLAGDRWETFQYRP